METPTRKGLKDAYKNKALVGGVYCIACEGNHRVWIKATKNLAGQQNKFAFAISTRSCPEPGMRNEWLQYGAQSFTFTVLETLVQKETQSEAEFAEDIGVLLEIWREKHPHDA